MQKIVLNQTKEGTDLYVIEDGELREMHRGHLQNDSILGNIYHGKVKDVVNGMQAAFIDLGIDKNAFISIKDAMEKVDVAKETLDISEKMTDILQIGQDILVQVKKEPTEEKGARVSTHITFPGKYVVLMPNTEIITVSQKIEEESEKERLKNIVKNALPEHFGAIIRTDAENIGESVLQADVLELLKAWNAIIEKYQKSKTIERLYDDHDIVTKAIRDVIHQNTDTVYCNEEKIRTRITKAIPHVKCVFEKGDWVDKLGLKSEIEKAENRKIWLKCGGYIVIDKTEALTAIDVNSGKYTGSKDLENTVLKVNLEAAVEIMKQIRLKDIGGIIVIDYIDMHQEEHEKQVLEVMRQEAKKDRSKVDIREFTQLNLVELTRKKMYV